MVLWRRLRQAVASGKHNAKQRIAHFSVSSLALLSNVPRIVELAGKNSPELEKVQPNGLAASTLSMRLKFVEMKLLKLSPVSSARVGACLCMCSTETLLEIHRASPILLSCRALQADQTF